MPESAQATYDEVAHLQGKKLPEIQLNSTLGQTQSLAELSKTSHWLIIYIHPNIGSPQRALLASNWHEIPGAFGCTAQSCGFRDLNTDIKAHGANICGLSTQIPTEQHEASTRLQLPFPLLSDHTLALTNNLKLPTWHINGNTLLKRFTIIAREKMIEHVIAPVTDPANHANKISDWIKAFPQ